MRKILSLVLALVMVLAMGSIAFAEEMTAVGTPRNETLIVETQTPTDVPGLRNLPMSSSVATARFPIRCPAKARAIRSPIPA